MIEKTVGRRTRPVETIQMKDILACGKQSEIPEQYDGAKNIRFTFKRKNKDTYYIIYKAQNRLYKAMMDPSGKFITYLENREQALHTENQADS